jgi:hypothetical protein
MNTWNTRGLLFLTVVALSALPIAAGATDVVGANTVLDAHGGQFYIPLKSSTSGTLGDDIPGPPSGDKVGLQADSLTLYNNGQTSSGFVSFVLSFNLGCEDLCCDSATLSLTFNDLDFKPYNVDSGHFSFRESLELSLLLDATDSLPATPDLTIDDSNYGNWYPGGPPGGETNNTVVTYVLDLKDDLGMTPADCAAINADHEFGLYLTFRTDITHLRRHCSGDTITNTRESMTNSLDPCVPEPATFLIVGAGALLLLLRKKKNA